MYINLTDYYDIESITYWKPSDIPLYDFELISKSTGEVITWTFTEKLFDKFLNDLEKENQHLEDSLYYVRKEKKSGGFYE